MTDTHDPSAFVLPPPPTPSVAVAGTSARFAVRRVFCVGRNYAAHAREMGKDPDREPPFFFMKPADAVVDDGATVPYPPETKNLHYEMELVVAIGRGGADITPEKALDYVWGYGVGIDLTRRDLQNAAKDLGTTLGLGEGLRFLRADRAAATGERSRTPGGGENLACRERRGQTGFRHLQADLADRRRDRDLLTLDDAEAGRSHHDRNTGRRGRRRQR